MKFRLVVNATPPLRRTMTRARHIRYNEVAHNKATAVTGMDRQRDSAARRQQNRCRRENEILSKRRSYQTCDQGNLDSCVGDISGGYSDTRNGERSNSRIAIIGMHGDALQTQATVKSNGLRTGYAIPCANISAAHHLPGCAPSGLPNMAAGGRQFNMQFTALWRVCALA